MNDISNSQNSNNHVQFRLYFAAPTTNKTAGWASGETVGSNMPAPPQLVVQYQPAL